MSPFTSLEDTRRAPARQEIRSSRLRSIGVLARKIVREASAVHRSQRVVSRRPQAAA